VDEQKLNDLISEISRLIDTIKKTSGQTATSGSVDSANDRLVRAIGLLAAKMDKTAISEENSIKKFVKAVDSATESVKKQADAAADIAQDEKARNAAERNAHNQSIKKEIDSNRLRTSSSREVFNAAKSMGGGINQLNNSFLNLGGSSNAANAGLQLLSAGFGGATKALTGYAKSLQQGERGAKLSGRALEEFATPILDTIGTLGTLAMVLPGVGKMFGSTTRIGIAASKGLFRIGGASAIATAAIGKFGIAIVKEGLNQADNLFDSFQKLSAAGLVGAGGVDDVFGMLQEMGMTSGEIGKFNSLIAGSAQTIKFLGATAADGAKEFTKVSGGLFKGKLGQQLQMLGVNQEEMNKLTLINMSIQARTGQLEKLSAEQRIASTAKFVKELDMAAQLTGATREQQAEAREAALADERFRAALAAARARGDEKELARLERAQALAATAKLAGDAEGATGILQLAASGGAMTTKAATAAEMTYRINEILDSNLSNNEAVARMAKTGEASLQGMAETNKLIGTIEGYQTNIVGAYNLVERIMPAILAAQEQGISLDEFLKNQQADRETAAKDTTGNTRLMVDAARMQQNAALIMDKSLYQLSSAAIIHQTATQMFETAVSKFAEITGTMPKSQVETGGTEVKAARAAADRAIREKEEAVAQQRTKNVLKNTIGGSMVGKDAEAEVTRRMQDMSGQLDLASGIHKMIMKFLSPGYSEGGIASGPASGHLAMLHGTEAVIPLKGGSIPMKILGSSRDIDSGPVFNPQSETNFLLDKQNQELGKMNVTLEEMLAYMLDGTISMTGTTPGVVGPGAGAGAGAGGGAGPTIPISGELGTMSAKYESGSAGSMAVGRDRSGGTSYGKYQIASKVGSMDAFLKLLEKNDPEAYARLMASGDQDAGIQGQFAQEWKKLVSEGRIQKSEREFAVEKIFQPAMKGIKDQDLSKMIGENKGLQEMMFSMAIQHGPGGAPAILNKVYKKGMKADELVNAAYEERGADKGQRYFSKSTENERAGVVSRFGRERQDVLAMLGQPSTAAAPGTPAATTAAAPPGTPGTPGTPAATTAAAPGTPGTLGTPAAAPAATTASAASSGGLINMLGGMLGISGPTTQKASAGPGGLTNLIGEAGSGIMGMLGLGAAPTSPGQPTMAGVPAGGQPGAIGTDISAITQAMQAQTAATQSAITTGMQDLTTRLVDKIGPGGSGGTAADPAVPTLLGDILTASREQTSAINRLIQVQTS
jgi:hypothetical protein